MQFRNGKAIVAPSKDESIAVWQLIDFLHRELYVDLKKMGAKIDVDLVSIYNWGFGDNESMEPTRKHLDIILTELPMFGPYFDPVGYQVEENEIKRDIRGLQRQMEELLKGRQLKL